MDREIDVDTFYIDISDVVNPPNFKGPEGYNASFFNNSEVVNTWKGLYVPKIKVLSPKDFLEDDLRTDFGNTSMIMGEGCIISGILLLILFLRPGKLRKDESIR